MDKLFFIEAEIFVPKKGQRTWPIKTGYRPGFSFMNKAQNSGVIILINTDFLRPGDKSKVQIGFVSDQPLGDISRGTTFRFYEGPVPIGEGIVLKVLGWSEKNSFL